MSENLQKPRPQAWTESPLFTFMEDCWGNSVAAVANKNIIAQRLTTIDNIFCELQQDLKLSAPAEIVPAFLMLRSFSAFRACAMVTLSLPTDGFALARSCLESAAYARVISITPGLAELWLKREGDEKAKYRFGNKIVREAITSADQDLANTYDTLYERSIDFGAHPNEKAVTFNLDRESLETDTLRFRLLPGDGPALDHALVNAARVGVCALKVIGLVFRPQFEALGLDEKIRKASKHF